MFRFSHGGRDCGPGGSGRGRRPEMDVERFFHWVERLNGGEPGRGRGRSRRMFDGGELRLVLLRLISDEPRHGYELIRAIEELTGGAYAPSPGVVYPTLTLLGEIGLIEEQASEGVKKRFAVTEAGAMHLEERRPQVEALMARLSEVGAHRQRTEAAPVQRAMSNLRHALHDRLGRGDLSGDAVLDLAALIDEVAHKVERTR